MLLNFRRHTRRYERSILDRAMSYRINTGMHAAYTHILRATAASEDTKSTLVASMAVTDRAHTDILSIQHRNRGNFSRAFFAIGYHPKNIT